MPAWCARLKNKGWHVEKFSVAIEIAAILKNAPMRKVWLAADSKAPLNWEKANKSLANALTGRNQLQERLEKKLSELDGRKDAKPPPRLRAGLFPPAGLSLLHVRSLFHSRAVETGRAVLAGSRGRPL